MNGHHLILGELIDFITGETLADTHDERYRQDLSRLLVNDRGYHKEEIAPRYELIVRADEKRAMIKIDFVVTLSEKKAMIIKYGPGSIVTRRRCALALSRLVEPYQIPCVVVTNGIDAEILEGTGGGVISSGLEGIPFREALLAQVKTFSFESVDAKRAELESRLAYAYEVDGSCPCDDTICRL